MSTQTNFLGLENYNILISRIKENFNKNQLSRFEIWVEELSKRPSQNQPILFIVKKDLFNKLIILYETTRFNGIGRCDTSITCYIDELGNIRIFVVSETCEDYLEREQKWIEIELFKQLSLNSKLIMHLERDYNIFKEIDF